MADTEEKLCRLVQEFGRVCKRKKLQANAGNSHQVVKCLSYINVGGMDARLNGDLLEEVDYCKRFGSQVTGDGGCERVVVHRMNEWEGGALRGLYR